MRSPAPLVIAVSLGAVAVARPSAARADVGLGLFLGEPTGVSLKVDVQRRAALDFVFGATSFRDSRANYAHLTYLVTPVLGHGRAVSIHLRVGVGAALFDGRGDFGDELNVAVRAPAQLAFVFRRTPLELYAELSAKVTFLDANDDQDLFDVDSGVGARLMF
jgi:hypothetical protein